MAFGNPDNCRLSDLGLITAGNGSSTSGSSTSQTALRANCANSSSATNVSIWNSFKSPTQTQMRSGTNLDDEPEDDEAELEDDDSESPTDRTPAPSSLPHPAATRLNVPKIHKR